MLKYERIIKKTIKKLNVSVNSISVNTLFNSIGIDSLKYITLLVELEKILNIEFPDEYLMISASDNIEKLNTIIKSIMKT